MSSTVGLLTITSLHALWGCTIFKWSVLVSFPLVRSLCTAIQRDSQFVEDRMCERQFFDSLFSVPSVFKYCTPLPCVVSPLPPPIVTNDGLPWEATSSFYTSPPLPELILNYSIWSIRVPPTDPWIDICSQATMLWNVHKMLSNAAPVHVWFIWCTPSWRYFILSLADTTRQGELLLVSNQILEHHMWYSSYRCMSDSSSTECTLQMQIDCECVHLHPID